MEWSGAPHLCAERPHLCLVLTVPQAASPLRKRRGGRGEATAGCSRIIATIQRASSTELPAESGEKRRRAGPVGGRPVFLFQPQKKNPTSPPPPPPPVFRLSPHGPTPTSHSPSNS